MSVITDTYGDAATIVQLRYARASAELGSFSRAALALGVSQPALSNGIASLERTLGALLFARSTRGVTLTSAGTLVLPHIRTILGSVESIAAEVVDLSGAPAPIRVGVSSLLQAGVIARALDAASKRALGALVLREDDMQPLRQALVARQLDVIFVPAVSDIAGFTRQVVETEPLHYLARSGPQQEGSEPIEFRVIADGPLVMVGDSCGLTTFIRGLYASSGRSLERYAGTADSYRSVEDWAALGLGWALLPRSKFRPETPTRPVHRDGRSVDVSYEAVWDADATRGAQVAELVNAMTS